MKNILALLFVGGVIFLASCGNGANTPLPVTPVPDSSTSGSKFWITFASDTFALQDYKLNGIPTFSLHASDIYNATDSLWECKVQVIDATTKTIAMNFTAENTTPTGTYTVTTNSSTLTDYSEGANKTYSIAIGSIVTITNSSYPIKGKMGLTLYYNHTTLYAIDSFAINN